MSKLSLPPGSALRSAFFAAIFAPVALILMGMSLADLQARAAIGVPLASVEGMIGMAFSAIILGMISINCERHSIGMFVAAAWALIIGFLQTFGYFRIQFLVAANLSADDMSAAQRWNLYPVCVAAILLGSGVALALTHRARAKNPETEKLMPFERHQSERIAVAVASLPLGIGALALLIRCAPADSLPMAARGLSGVVAQTPLQPILSAAVAEVLGLIALASRWSMIGPQLIAWTYIIPGFLLIPLGTTLTGVVVTPGHSLGTQVLMAASTIAAYGMILAASTLGIYWARRYATNDSSSND